MPEATMNDAMYKATIEDFLAKGFAPPNVDRNKAPSALRAAQQHLRDGGIVAVSSNFLFDWVVRQERLRENGRDHMLPDWDLYPPLAAKRGKKGFEPVLPGFEVTQTTTVLDKNGQVTREFITQKQESSLEPFEVPANHQIKGISAYTNAEGQVIKQWIKTKENSVDLLAAQEAIKEFMAEYKDFSKLPPEPSLVDADLLTAYWIGDHHLGMFSWKDETGEDYDLKLGDQILRETMSKLVAMAPPSKIGMVVSLGDFFHTDSSANATPRSHHALDVDTRRAKVYKIGLKLMIQCIELALQKHEKVLVRTLPGNHDPETTPALAWALWAFFHNNERVEVDVSSSKFFFYQFGSTMLAGTHGDATRINEMPRIMAQVKAKMWGDTLFRYAFGGHVHHKQQFAQKEIGGVIAETVQILPPADSYHAAHGYGAGRSMLSTTYSRTGGEFLRHTVNIVPSEREDKVI